MKRPERLQYDHLKQESRRDKEHDPFYSSAAWRKTRRAFLAEHPLCVKCKELGYIKEARVVDHILPRTQGGADLNWSNLQPLCDHHHNVKSAKEKNQKQVKK